MTNPLTPEQIELLRSLPSYSTPPGIVPLRYEPKYDALIKAKLAEAWQDAQAASIAQMPDRISRTPAADTLLATIDSQAPSQEVRDGLVEAAEAAVEGLRSVAKYFDDQGLANDYTEASLDADRLEVALVNTQSATKVLRDLVTGIEALHAISMHATGERLGAVDVEAIQHEYDNAVRFLAVEKCSPPEVVNIARCPIHGLHGERTECFVCRGPVEQVAMVPVTGESK